MLHPNQGNISSAKRADGKELNDISKIHATWRKDGGGLMRGAEQRSRGYFSINPHLHVFCVINYARRFANGVIYESKYLMERKKRFKLMYSHVTKMETISQKD